MLATQGLNLRGPPVMSVRHDVSRILSVQLAIAHNARYFPLSRRCHAFCLSPRYRPQQPIGRIRYPHVPACPSVSAPIPLRVCLIRSTAASLWNLRSSYVPTNRSRSLWHERSHLPLKRLRKRIPVVGADMCPLPLDRMCCRSAACRPAAVSSPGVACVVTRVVIGYSHA